LSLLRELEHHYAFVVNELPADIFKMLIRDCMRDSLT
jgi:hypothetical protein